MKTKETIKKYLPQIANFKDNQVIKKWGGDLYRQHKRHNVQSKVNQDKAGYRIMLNGHALEKGMTSSSPRYFGATKTQEIIKLLTLYEKNDWAKNFAYDFGVSILKSYCDFYEKHEWTHREEYKKTKRFVFRKQAKYTVGAMTIRKKDFIENASIDYDKFLSSRHSIRSFAKKKITSSDVVKAIKMALKTPTACNRQMLKVYFVRSNEIKNKIIKYSKGMTGFDIDSANMLVVTYDVSAFRRHELNQGLFNAGLFSTNLVNALHSIGIGSCMLEYWVKTSEENEEKQILGIPENEKIAIVIAAGYYPEESIVPRSVRKPLEEIYKEV